jgi:hypothetical protein
MFEAAVTRPYTSITNWGILALDPYDPLTPPDAGMTVRGTVPNARFEAFKLLIVFPVVTIDAGGAPFVIESHISIFY